MKNKILLSLFVLIVIHSCNDPVKDEPEYFVFNGTTQDIIFNFFVKGLPKEISRIPTKSNTWTGGGGVLNTDSVRFIVNNDTLIYSNSADTVYRKTKYFHFYNRENWVYDGQDFIYTVEEEHWAKMDTALKELGFK